MSVSGLDPNMMPPPLKTKTKPFKKGDKIMMGPTVPPRTGKLPDDWTPKPSKLDEILDTFYKDSKVVAVGLPIKPHIDAKSQILALFEEVLGSDQPDLASNYMDPQNMGLPLQAIVFRNQLRAEQRLRKDNL